MRHDKEHVEIAKAEGRVLFKLVIDKKYTVKKGKNFAGGCMAIKGAASAEDAAKLRALYLELNGIPNAIATAQRKALLMEIAVKLSAAFGTEVYNAKIAPVLRGAGKP